jgi:hypothetical protein
VSWRHVNHQVPNVSTLARLKVLANGMKVPSINELIVALNEMPCGLHETMKAPLKILSRKIEYRLKFIVPNVMRV